MMRMMMHNSESSLFSDVPVLFMAGGEVLPEHGENLS